MMHAYISTLLTADSQSFPKYCQWSVSCMIGSYEFKRVRHLPPFPERSDSGVELGSGIRRIGSGSPQPTIWCCLVYLPVSSKASRFTGVVKCKSCFSTKRARDLILSTWLVKQGFTSRHIPAQRQRFQALDLIVRMTAWLSTRLPLLWPQAARPLWAPRESSTLRGRQGQLSTQVHYCWPTTAPCLLLVMHVSTLCLHCSQHQRSSSMPAKKFDCLP